MVDCPIKVAKRTRPYKVTPSTSSSTNRPKKATNSIVASAASKVAAQKAKSSTFEAEKASATERPREKRAIPKALKRHRKLVRERPRTPQESKKEHPTVVPVAREEEREVFVGANEDDETAELQPPVTEICTRKKTRALHQDHTGIRSHRQRQQTPPLPSQIPRNSPSVTSSMAPSLAPSTSDRQTSRKRLNRIDHFYDECASELTDDREEAWRRGSFSPSVKGDERMQNNSEAGEPGIGRINEDNLLQMLEQQMDLGDINMSSSTADFKDNQSYRHERRDHPSPRECRRPNRISPDSVAASEALTSMSRRVSSHSASVQNVATNIRLKQQALQKRRLAPSPSSTSTEKDLSLFELDHQVHQFRARLQNMEQKSPSPASNPTSIVPSSAPSPRPTSLAINFVKEPEPRIIPSPSKTRVQPTNSVAADIDVGVPPSLALRLEKARRLRNLGIFSGEQRLSTTSRIVAIRKRQAADRAIKGATNRATGAQAACLPMGVEHVQALASQDKVQSKPIPEKSEARFLKTDDIPIQENTPVREKKDEVKQQRADTLDPISQISNALKKDARLGKERRPQLKPFKKVHITEERDEIIPSRKIEVDEISVGREPIEQPVATLNSVFFASLALLSPKKKDDLDTEDTVDSGRPNETFLSCFSSKLRSAPEKPPDPLPPTPKIDNTAASKQQPLMTVQTTLSDETGPVVVAPAPVVQEVVSEVHFGLKPSRVDKMIDEEGSAIVDSGGCQSSHLDTESCEASTLENSVIEVPYCSISTGRVETKKTDKTRHCSQPKTAEQPPTTSAKKQKLERSDERGADPGSRRSSSRNRSPAEENDQQQPRRSSRNGKKNDVTSMHAIRRRRRPNKYVQMGERYKHMSTSQAIEYDEDETPLDEIEIDSATVDISALSFVIFHEGTRRDIGTSPKWLPWGCGDSYGELEYY